MGKPGHTITLVFNEQEEKHHIRSLRKLAIEPARESCVSVAETGEVLIVDSPSESSPTRLEPAAEQQ